MLDATPMRKASSAPDRKSAIKMTVERATKYYETRTGSVHALDNISTQGTTAFEGGKPMPYSLTIERDPGRQLVVHVLFDGREGGRTEIDFAGEGADTLVTAKAHGERAVLSQALAGTDKARLAYAPDWNLSRVFAFANNTGEPGGLVVPEARTAFVVISRSSFASVIERSAASVSK